MTRRSHVAIDAEYPRRQALPLPGGHHAWSRTSTCSPPRPAQDINWLEDVELLDGGRRAGRVRPLLELVPASIYFDIPEGRENEIARKVLIKHLQSGNSYGIQLKAQALQVPPAGARLVGGGLATVGTDWTPPVLEGWEPPAH